MTKLRPLLFALGAALMLAALAIHLLNPAGPSRPAGQIQDLKSLPGTGLNVIFILIDTQRADRLGSYGYERPTSPLLDARTANGVRFARAEAQSSWTKASMASMWTGVLPPRTGVVRYLHGLPDQVVMPAEIFREAGYVTAGLWRNGWVAPNFGFHQGFDLYVKPTPNKQNRQEHPDRPGAQKLPGTDADITNAAIEFLNTHRSDDFLLYLHYMDVHQYVYDEEAAALEFGGSLSDAYDAAIHWTDRNVEEVMRALERLEILDETLVVIASDHGEAFREHGLEGHARNLYRETVEVPLIFLLPFELKDGLVVDQVVRNVDIWPTVLELAGLPALPDTDGVSLVPAMLAASEGGSAEVPPSISYLDQTWGTVDAEPSPLISIRDQDRRVIYKPETPDESLEIFDHRLDPMEQHNLRETPPEWAAALQQQLGESLDGEAPWGVAEEVELDDMYLQQLRALGYVVK